MQTNVKRIKSSFLLPSFLCLALKDKLLISAYLLNRDARKLSEVSKLMSETPKVSMNFHGSVGNAAGEVQGDQKNIQYNYAAEQKQSILEVTAEIQQLFTQLAQTYPTTTEAQRYVIAGQAIQGKAKENPTFRQRLLSATKAGSIELVKVITDNPFVSVPIETIRGWIECE
jgi:hypothetical protein